MNSVSMAARAVQQLGLAALTQYGLYRLGLRSGWLARRTPIRPWDAYPLQNALRSGIPNEPQAYLDYRAQSGARFFVQDGVTRWDTLADLYTQDAGAAPQEARDVLEGRFHYFGGLTADLGFPPPWLGYPPEAGVGAASIEPQRHWSRYALNEQPADIKWVWELSRFGWAYALARAYRVRAEDVFADAFFELLASWRASNLPNAGPNWASAQEVALRSLALTFAVYAFQPAISHCPERLVTLVQTIAVHAARIPPTLRYSRAQGNNHLLVEATALYTVGMLFPELKAAGYWRRIGRQWVEHALQSQIFPDGGYVQHSTNYQRLALQSATWALNLGALNGEPFADKVISNTNRMLSLLIDLVDENGRAPNFGPNDGSNILPLTQCGIEDYRPALQAAAVGFQQRALFPAGPWDEACFWLGLDPGLWTRRGEIPTEAQANLLRADAGVSPAGTPRAFPHAGLYPLKHTEARGILRCAEFSSRPGHSDQLHFDLWWRGINVARDAGSYHYNAAPPWDNPFNAAAQHNTVVLNGQDPMRRAGTFLWLDWAQGRFCGRWGSPDGLMELLTAEHDGYARMGVRHRRTVVRAGSLHWIVVDDLIGSGSLTARLAWLLPDLGWEEEGGRYRIACRYGPITVRVDASPLRTALYRAGTLVDGESIPTADVTWGWHSPTYAVKEPALRLVAESDLDLPGRMITFWGFGELGLTEELEIGWRDPGAETALAMMTYRGEHMETTDAYRSDTPGIRGAR